jgi:nitric oxide reductase large subunit
LLVSAHNCIENQLWLVIFLFVEHAFDYCAIGIVCLSFLKDNVIKDVAVVGF